MRIRHYITTQGIMNIDGRFGQRNIKVWLASAGIPYHSPHKFRHGHNHYGSPHAKTIEDFKVDSMKITDEFYSNLNDNEVQVRINSLGKENKSNENDQEAIDLFKEFLDWKQKTK